MKEKLKPYFTIAYWKPKLKTAVQFLLNPRFVLCFGLAWFLTNGWCYAAVALGTYWKLPWLTGIGTAWMTALWFPFTPEKIITVIIAMWLLKLLFPNDQKTLAVLHRMREDLVRKHRAHQAERKRKKAEKRNGAGDEAPAPAETEQESKPSEADKPEP